MLRKLLIIGYVWPEPNSSAAGSRMMQLIELLLAHHWAITFASAALLSEHRFDLTTIGVEEKAIELNNSSFDEWIAQLQPQAVLFDRFFTEEQFGWRVEKMCPAALRILDTEDLHSLRHARHQLLKQAQKVMGSESERYTIDPVTADCETLYRVMAQDDMSQREIAAIYRCDLSLIISTFEMDFLQRYFSLPSHILFYCPFLNNQPIDSNFLPEFSQRNHFVSIGNFRHEPNWDAVLYLKHAIWPRIRSQLPAAELHIYGAYPPPKATQLHQAKDGFLVKGWVTDALSVMRNAKICLAPLRFGAGIKGKLMDAMRSGTPSVTTDIGAEGMHDDLLWGGSIENDAGAFANAAVKLYSSEGCWKKAQKQSLTVLQQCFLQTDYTGLFIERINQLQVDVGKERERNFVGAMLRHHTLKSTQYMSQWIEAKNKYGMR